MSEWIDATVADVTKYQKAGGTPVATNPDYYGGDIPFVVIEDITKSSRFLEKTENTLSGQGLLNSAAWLIQEPHILYSMYATVGKPIINKIVCATNQAIIALKENELVDQEFLYYQLLFIKPSVHKFTAQTTQSNLNAGVVKRLPITYPKNKATQRKIVEILSTIDQTIAHTEALIQKYQQIKAGLMHDLFIRGITSDGQLRPPRKEAPELYQETAIGWIPREWKAKDLGSACDWYSGGTPSRGNQEWWEGKVPWLSPKDMKSFDLSDTEEHVTKIAAISGSRLMPPATVFIVIRGMILAHTFPVVYSSSEFCFNQDIKSVSGRDELNNRFLAYWFVSNQDLFLKKTTEATHGTKRFDMKDLYDVIIGVPSPDEQTQIVLRLEVLTDQLKSEGACLSKLKKQKSGLMQDLLTGKVPVTISES